MDSLSIRPSPPEKPDTQAKLWTQRWLYGLSRDHARGGETGKENISIEGAALVTSLIPKWRSNYVLASYGSDKSVNSSSEMRDSDGKENKSIIKSGEATRGGFSRGSPQRT
ncbi:hypothetical protein OS493_036774 [Desmophyllum pertusum]|uniref:Uncharacterized protein n=1 Tax=Desmophyllum pertusum TaxID=174260 RepID=A0A9W9YI52_9CNID|nr:hypothetical protein OS493_036774 [Desmophyllum pertusum]